MNKTCSVWFCDRKHYAKGYCVNHYRGLQRYGSPYGKHDAEFMRIDIAIELSRKVASALLFCCKDQRSFDNAARLLELVK